jgi:inosine-uridine nucleoside N-ribohydrolase
MPDRLPVILDVDTGTDDALAIAYAVQSPRVDLLAVTTVAGNVDVEKTTANSLAVLDWLGAGDVPVHRGASRPLVRPHEDASWVHHEGGLGGARIPASARAVAADRGPAAIVRLANARPGEVTLVAVGPLTNIAIALNVEPRLPELLKAVVIMGGAFTVPGNTTPTAEYNILADPEAAGQVFAAGFRSLTAIGLDVTHQVALTKVDWEGSVGRADLPRSAALFAEVGGHFFGGRKAARFHLHDPLAIMVAVDPGLVRGEEAAVVVDLVAPEHGRTRMDGAGTTTVALEVEAERALAEFRQTVGLDSAGD